MKKSSAKKISKKIIFFEKGVDKSRILWYHIRAVERSGLKKTKKQFNK